MVPRKPECVSAFAGAVLEALSESGTGRHVSLGGAFALLHFLSHRDTHDLDAWWEPTATGTDRESVLGTVERALSRFGTTRRRSWGDVTGIDLLQDGRRVFNVQIADRSVRLEPPVDAPWPALRLDSLDDLVASKMTALVERGAPRDFVDIRALCRAGILEPADCWRLWKTRQERAGSDADPGRARLAVETHLERIEAFRPLDAIESAERRAEAEKTRNWFRRDFLDALPD